MEEFVNTCEIIWPYRFDLLVRIDFLEWFETIGRDYLPKSDLRSTITRDPLMSNRGFFMEAKQHPYFVQYTKLKRRYRLRNLTYQEAEPIYAEGIENFIKLNEDIKANSFDLKKRIVFKRPLLKIEPTSKETILGEYYIGDGCHRLACLIWLNKEFVLPEKFFRLSYRLRDNRANSNLTAGYQLLGILTGEDIKQGNLIFGGETIPQWDLAIQWISEIRERFKHMDIETMFKTIFRKPDFN